MNYQTYDWSADSTNVLWDAWIFPKKIVEQGSFCFLVPSWVLRLLSVLRCETAGEDSGESVKKNLNL